MSEEPEAARVRQLETLLDRVDEDAPRVVVRWVDETRITPTAEGGYTVAPQSYATFTLRSEGQAIQERVDGLTLAQIKAILGKRPLQVLYRSDNITA